MSFDKSLRANGSTPPAKAFNTRYGPVSSGSKGPMDADEFESPLSRPNAAGPSPSSASVGKPTPRQGGRFVGTPPRDTTPFGSIGKATKGKTGLAAASRPTVQRLNSTVDTDADSVSVAESDDVSVMTEDDYGPQEGDSVQVFVRVRPTNAAEDAEGDGYTCTRTEGERRLYLEHKQRSEPYLFKFDSVLPEATTQEEVFERAGKPIVDNCMGGYNSSIFAYGQTGAGKTYTMQGPLSAALQDDNPQRGLAPRVFQYLFTEIDKAQDEYCHENLTFLCKCSMLEIYNEVITDLINPAGTNLQIREDIKRGCYVEDLSEHTVQNVSDAMALMRKGAENRHTGETRLNRESSRSHSVFTCVLERQSKNQATGITNVLFSRLNLIDLAGSERVHGGEHGGSQATGKHFKEACHINKSLTTLGRVITELVEAQRTTQGRGGASVGKGTPANRARHVPYRDSRLTFLLQDSLGGNAKTLMIANISPSSVSSNETLSTLQFMSRAKCIRNRAKINLDAQGDVQVLQREIARLNGELDNLRKGYTEPAIQENKQLRSELDKLRDSRGETQIRLVNLEKENQNLKAERRRLDNKLAQVQKGSNQLGAAMFTLSIKMESYEAERDREMQRVLEIGQLERQLLEAELQAAQRESQDTIELQGAVAELQQQLAEARMAAESSAGAAEAASAELAALKVQLETEQQQNVAIAKEASTAQQQAADLMAQLAESKQQAASVGEQLQAAQLECSQLTEQLQSAVQESAGVSTTLEAAQQQVADLELQLNSTRQESVAVCEQLSTSQGEVTSLQAQLSFVQQESLDLAAQLPDFKQGSAKLQQQLEAAQTASASLSEELEASRQQHAAVLEQLEAAQQDATAMAMKSQEEHEAAAARQLQLCASLEASAAQVQTLQQELQDSKAEAQGLKQDCDDVRQQLEQEQQEAAATRQQFAEVKEQLAATQRELEQSKEMATCTEAEAGKRLADALAAADEAQQAVQQQHSLNADLQEQLQALHTQLAQTKQELQQEAQARKQEGDIAASSQAAADAIEQQLREQLEALQQLLATKQEDLGSLDSEKQELHSKLGLKQQQCSELQQQLEAEQGRSAESRSEGAALQEAVAELNTLVRDRSTALDAAQEQVRQLQQVQQQKEEALASAAAKHEQLSSDLTSLREGSKGKQDELMKQVTEVHMQLSAAQQEQEKLQEELDGMRNDNSALQAQLADAQGETDSFRGQASSKGLEVELLRKKLAAADGNAAALHSDLQYAQQEASELRQQMQDMDAEARELQAAADEQLSELKRALLDKDQLLQEYDYDKSQMQRRMEELAQKLADKSSSLEGRKSEVQALKAQILDQSAAARSQEAALKEQYAHKKELQAENASLAAKLAYVSDQLAATQDELWGKLNNHERQLKEQMVYNARNRQAMNEIRKVINWAQQMPAQQSSAAATPPHGSTVSRPGSSASRRAGVFPMGHFDAGSIPGSPASSHYGDLLPAEPHSDAPEHGEEASRGAVPTLQVPSSGRHHSSHLGYGHSRHQHHIHLEHRGADPLMVTPGSEGCLMAGRAGSNSGSSASSRRVGKGATGGSSPSKMQLASRAGDMMPLMLQVSGDLHVNAAGEGSAASGCQERDTVGGAGPDSPTVPEAAVCLAPASRSRGIGSHRMGSPTRSSGSKQQLAAALAAAQHKMLPDQQHHHAKPQERYASDAEDDTLPGPGPEDSFECQEEHTYCDGRSGAAGDGRHLMAPQRASSPVGSPTKELQHCGASRNRSSRRGLRAGSDTHSFSSMGGKLRHHKMVPGEAHPVVLSVSGEWSAGGHDSIPDMRLPAAIVGDDGQQA